MNEHNTENDALREAAAIGWDACVEALRYEDGTPVEVVTMVNPYRATPPGLHACVGCGLELDGDDPNDRCDECVTPPGVDQ